MIQHRYLKAGVRILTLAAFVVLSTTQLTSCDGVLPPLTITFNLVQDAEISATDSATGSAQVNLPVFCDLFSPESLDMLVRNAAGDLIADLVTITSVELQSTNIAATQGTFDPFTNATLTLSVIGDDPILLGDAASNDGLGLSYMLTQEMNVDLLNDLEDGQCGIPTLRVSGGDLLESGDITFDATVTVLVFTQLTP